MLVRYTAVDDSRRPTSSDASPRGSRRRWGLSRTLLRLASSASLLLLICCAGLWLSSHLSPANYAIKLAPSYAHGWGVKFFEADVQNGGAGATIYVETNPS